VILQRDFLKSLSILADEVSIGYLSSWTANPWSGNQRCYWMISRQPKETLVKKEEAFQINLETDQTLEVLVQTLGAGDIDRLVPALAEMDKGNELKRHCHYDKVQSKKGHRFCSPSAWHRCWLYRILWEANALIKPIRERRFLLRDWAGSISLEKQKSPRF